MTHPVLQNNMPMFTPIGQQNPIDVYAALEQLVVELDQIRMHGTPEHVEDRLDRLEAVALLTTAAALQFMNERNA